MASTPVIGLLGVMLLVGAGLVVGGGVNAIQILRVRRRARSNTTRAGLVSLSGRAEAMDPGGPVTSPLTGRSALVYEFEVRPDSGRQTASQQPAVQGRESVPFILTVGDRRVGVDPSEGATALAPTLDVTAEADRYDALAAAGVSVTNDADAGPPHGGRVELPADGQYRVIERRLAVGDTVTVTGHATPVRDTTTDEPALDMVVGAPSRDLRSRFLGVPFVVGDAGPDRATRRLLDRALVGLVFGLPLVLLSLVLLFPPSAP